jgi:hypothetical protein
MKFTLLCLAVLCFGAMKAQTVNDVPLKDIDVDYVEIVGSSKAFSTKLNINLDFGQHTKMFSTGKESKVKDENGKQLEFNSMIDALNFMSANGFEFVSSYAVTADGGQSVYHYLLRKKK